MVAGGLGVAAVVFADCVDVSSPSPGNSRAVWGLREEGALIEAVLPPAPVVVVGPVVVTDDDAAENVDVDGSGDVATPSEPDAAALPPAVWPSVAVWAWAAAIPRRMIATRIVRCIALSCLSKRHTKAAPFVRYGKTTPDRSKRKMKFRKAAAGTARCVSGHFPATTISRLCCAERRTSRGQSPTKKRKSPGAGTTAAAACNGKFCARIRRRRARRSNKRSHRCSKK